MTKIRKPDQSHTESDNRRTTHAFNAASVLGVSFRDFSVLVKVDMHFFKPRHRTKSEFKRLPTVSFALVMRGDGTHVVISHGGLKGRDG